MNHRIRTTLASTAATAAAAAVLSVGSPASAAPARAAADPAPPKGTTLAEARHAEAVQPSAEQIRAQVRVLTGLDLTLRRAAPRPYCFLRSEVGRFRFEKRASDKSTSRELGLLNWNWCFSHDGQRQWAKMVRITLFVDRHGKHESCNTLIDAFTGAKIQVRVWEPEGDHDQSSRFKHVPCDVDTENHGSWSLHRWKRFTFDGNDEEVEPKWTMKVVEQWKHWPDKTMKHTDQLHRVPTF
jgi:hypothetical protein